MEGVTDIMFRRVVARAGRPDLFFTEFTNVSSYASEKGRANALERLEIAPTDSPIIAQIWGKDPAHFAECAAALESLKSLLITRFPAAGINAVLQSAGLYFILKNSSLLHKISGGKK